MINRNIKRLNEEISRWAFEIKINTLNNWEIIFTNPTAGPWKKITCYNKFNKKEEIYRFQLEEERPDIIMINDDLNIIIIIEAKDNLNKLLDKTQLMKTIEVTENMAKMFKENENENWKRNNYTTILGLLWGADEPNSKESIELLFNNHYKIIKEKSNIYHNTLFGVETLYNKNTNSIKCFDNYYGSDNELITKIKNSFFEIFNN